MLIDCSFEDEMSFLEKNKVTWGLEQAYSINRKHKQPFDIHLCGVKPNSVIIDKLRERIPCIDTSPLSIHSECYTEIYPKERIVMLTSDSENVLEYNWNDIYVVGAIVDMGRHEPLTLTKANALGIRTAKLPLHLIKFGPCGGKELSFRHVIDCVRGRQTNENWKEVLEEFVPKLKQEKYQYLKQLEQYNYENEN